MTPYPRMYKIFLCRFSLHFLVSFMEKKPPIKFIGVFVYFLRTYEVPKFWMIKNYLDISDVIHANEHSKYAYYGLNVNFWIFRQCHFVLWWKMIILRYYATFKVRKFESLFYKTDTYWQKTTTCTGLEADQIFSVSI